MHDFYDQLLCHVQALDTLGKLERVTGNVQMTLDKLGGIQADITRRDSKWKTWTFHELLEALKGWIDRNPSHSGDRVVKFLGRDSRKEKSFSARGENKSKSCVYCDKQDHKSA